MSKQGEEELLDMLSYKKWEKLWYGRPYTIIMGRPPDIIKKLPKDERAKKLKELAWIKHRLRTWQDVTDEEVDEFKRYLKAGAVILSPGSPDDDEFSGKRIKRMRTLSEPDHLLAYVEKVEANQEEAKQGEAKQKAKPKVKKEVKQKADVPANTNIWKALDQELEKKRLEKGASLSNQMAAASAAGAIPEAWESGWARDCMWIFFFSILRILMLIDYYRFYTSVVP
jgi:hypothetical protein